MILRLPSRPAVLSLFAVIAAAVAPQAVAQRPANINITPKRLTLDSAHPTGTIYVYNQGDEPATFDISLVDRVMLPDGQIVALEDASAKPGQKPYADQLKSGRDIMTVSPRHVSLGARKGQAIRLRVSGLPDAPAEFRSHLTISTLPDRSAGTTAEEAAAGPNNQLRIAVNAVYGVSMPIIARAGAVDVRAAIENAHVDVVNMRANATAPVAPTAVVSFDLVRLGANSLFGDINIRFADQPPIGQPVGLAINAGVYPEIQRRHFQLPLNHRPNPGEPIQITFTDQDAAPGKVLATTTIR